MKRYLSVAVSTMLALSMLGGTAVEAYAGESVSLESGIVDLFESVIVNDSEFATPEFSIDSNGKVKLSNSSGNVFDVIEIPSNVNGTDVKEIALSGFKSVKANKIIIPEGVTIINSQAFMNSNVAEVELPSTVTTLGANAFYGTKISSIDLPDGLISIGSSCFSHCSNLTELNLPDSVTTLKASAFSSCTRLTSVTLPKGVTDISSNLLSGCTNLAKINVSDANETYSSIDGVVFSKDGTTLMLYPAAHGDTYSVPDGVTTISNGVFLNNEVITSVTLPSTLTNIKTSAFSGCTALASVNLPSSVTSIADKAFYNCSALVLNGDLPTGLTTLGESSFLGCEKITSITVPSGISELEASVFRGCTSLKSVTFKNTKMTSIGNEAFQQCESLQSITLPDSISYIGEQAFMGCYSLKSITLPDSLTSLSPNLLSSCTSLTSVTFGSQVTKIGAGAFNTCTSLASIVIPDSVKDIANGAFKECINLSSIKLPIGLETIGEYTFSKCESLKEIQIPQYVSDISSNAFTNSGIQKVYCYPGTLADNTALYPDGTVIKYIDIFGNPLKLINATFDIGNWSLKESNGMNTAYVSTSSGSKTMTLDIEGDGILYTELAVSSNAGSVLTITNDGVTVATIKGSDGYTEATPYKLCTSLHTGTNKLVFTYSSSTAADTAYVRNVRLAENNDANLDGEVDIRDAAQAVAYASKVSSNAFGEATVKGSDSTVTREKAAKLLRQLAGLD